MSESDVTWFSQFFGLNKPQYELPFVDFNLHADVPVYIDPYAITKHPSDLASKCHNSIVSYFQLLLEKIVDDDSKQVRRLIKGRFEEPNELHFGVGKTARGGRGIGGIQEQQIIDALTISNAAKKGAIDQIQELELHIPGIGADKIADLVANIILGHLAEYTASICEEYGISSRPCAISGFWNSDTCEWDGGHFNLPVHGTHSYVLVPKHFVRLEKDLMNHREFYNKYILEVLQREMLTANDSLVQTLKNGKRRVTKKSLKEDPRFPFTKEFISQFIVENPDVIEAYRGELLDKYVPLDPAFWSGKYEEDDSEIQELLDRLEELEPGTKDANAYHETVFGLLKYVFDWVLENFESEFKMDGGRGRIDIIADNFASGGLFAELRDEYSATSIPMECKNYSSDLGNNEFNQINDRLGTKTSRIGIVFCRTVENEKAMLKHRTDRWLRHENMILLISDAELKELVQRRIYKELRGIESYIRSLIRQVKFGGN